MRQILTLEQLLAKQSDGVLLDIQKEILAEVVPLAGAAQQYCRKVNKMIDEGELCINPTAHRRVYLPTLARAVQKECARRYVNMLITGCPNA